MSSNVIYAQFGRGLAPVDRSPDAELPEGAERLLGFAESEGWPIHPTVLVDTVRLVYLASQPFERGASAIRQEPTLGARALRLANGPAYAAELPCMHVGAAIERLGERGVSTLLVGVACTRLYAGASEAELAKRLVVRSAAVAFASEMILRQRGAPSADALLAGCLHDIGWTCGLALAEQHAAHLPQRWRGDRSARIAGVAAVHAQLGAVASRAWGLSAPIADAIADHHAGVHADEAPLTQAIALATRCVDQLAVAGDPAPLGFDTANLDNEAGPELRSDVWTELQRLGLAPERRCAVRPIRSDRRRSAKKIVRAS
ncbi:hypothetical protein LBMAG42_12450 [Deltaproteobacteria bacterium]|nr:hypothetical protein LBMAG42_12450 [Deltaproteobacteria bacterium]